MGLGEKFVNAVSGLTLLKDNVPPLVPVDGEAGSNITAGASRIVS